MRWFLVGVMLLTAGCRNVAQLAVNSEPSGAQVWLDHDSTGLVTDCVIPDVYAGTHCVELRTGPFRWSEVVTLERGEQATREASFPELAWSDSTPAGRSTVAVGPDGIVYTAHVDYGNHVNLRAFAPTGGALWSWTLGPGSSSAGIAVADDGTIYVQGEDSLWAVDPDGDPLWVFHPAVHDYFAAGPSIGADGTVYAGFEERLYAISSSGTERWSVQTGPGRVATAPAIGADGTIYVWTFYDWLLAFSPAGKLVWSYRPAEPRSAPGGLAIGPDGTIYVASDGRLIAVDADGSEKWLGFYGPPGTTRSPVVGADGTAYVSSNGQVCAVRPEDGGVRWTKELYNEHAASLAVGGDGAVFAAGDGFEAVAAGGCTGWRLLNATLAYDWSPAALMPDGILYAAGDCDIYAVRAGGGPAVSSWPMYQHDPQRTGRAR